MCPALALAPGLGGLHPPRVSAKGQGKGPVGVDGSVVASTVDKAGLRFVVAKDVLVQFVGAIQVVRGEGHFDLVAALGI